MLATVANILVVDVGTHCRLAVDILANVITDISRFIFVCFIKTQAGGTAACFVYSWISRLGTLTCGYLLLLCHYPIYLE